MWWSNTRKIGIDTFYCSYCLIDHLFMIRRVRLPSVILFGSPSEELKGVIDYVDDLKKKLFTLHGTVLHKGNSLRFRAGEEGKVVSRSWHQTGKVHILSWPRSTMSFTGFEKDENEECSLELMNTTVIPLTFLIATIRTKEWTVLRNKPTRRSVTTRMGFLEGFLVRWFIIGDGGARIKKNQEAEVVVVLQKNLDRKISRKEHMGLNRRYLSEQVSLVQSIRIEWMIKN